MSVTISVDSTTKTLYKRLCSAQATSCTLKTAFGNFPFTNIGTLYSINVINPTIKEHVLCCSTSGNELKATCIKLLQMNSSAISFVKAP